MAKVLDWRAATLKGVRDLTADIRLFEIGVEGAFVAPTPGSHINVAVQIGERPDVRSYSIVGPCSDGLYRIAVKRLPDSRGGSLYMWSLAPGARMSVTTPGNHFELGPNRPHYLLLAGGIGITPIYTMALALSAAQADVRMLYASRSAADAAFADELRDVLGARLELFLDDDGQRVDIDAEIAALPTGGEFYVCGPIGMLEAAKHAWARSARPVDLLRFETFGNSGRMATQAFTVKIPRLGKVIEVPRTSTMLEALEAAGVQMIFDCRRGECGLCALDITDVAGAVDHRDVFFSDEQKAENAKLCTCVSRAIGTITVDTADRVA